MQYQPPVEIIDDEYPHWLTTGRLHAHYHTGTMTRNSPTLDREVPEGRLEINPGDAGRLDIHWGDPVRVVSRRGQVTVKAEITERVEQGLVFLPFHFVESCANILTNPACDPKAKIPELKVCAVRLEKVGQII